MLRWMHHRYRKQVAFRKGENRMIGDWRRSIVGGRTAAIALLTLLVPLALAACGGSAPATDTPKPVPIVAPTTAAAASPTTAAKPSATPDDYPAGTPAPT